MAGRRTMIAVFFAALIPSAFSFCTVLDVKNSSAFIKVPQTFPQPLDHSDANNDAVLDQTFWERCDLYEDGGPVFLSVEGHEPIKDPWPTDSSLEHYAKKHKALVFKLEHRYYGSSRPKDSGSYQKEGNLKYLSSFQALMDLVNFIQTINRQHPLLKDRGQPPRWITFGCFYGGTLATWLRAKYPHLVYGAVASSAPLLARLDSPEYIADIANALDERRKDCGTEVKMAIYNFKKSTLLCDTTRDELTDEETIILLDMARKTVELIGDENSMTTFCDIMLNNSVDSPMVRFERGLEKFGFNMTLECNYYDNYRCYQTGNWTPNDMCPKYRETLYQQCSEFGHFQVLEKGSIPPFIIEQCTSSFGQKFSESYIINAIKNTNMMYGGISVDISRLVSIQGSLNPWRTLGLMSNKDTDTYVITMQGVFKKCADLQLPSSNDSSGLKANLQEVSRIIGKWLEESQTEPPELVIDQDEDSSESSDIPWTFILISIFIACVVVAALVIVKFRISTKTLHL